MLGLQQDLRALASQWAGAGPVRSPAGRCQETSRPSDSLQSDQVRRVGPDSGRLGSAEERDTQLPGAPSSFLARLASVCYREAGGCPPGKGPCFQERRGQRSWDPLPRWGGGFIPALTTHRAPRRCQALHLQAAVPTKAVSLPLDYIKGNGGA